MEKQFHRKVLQLVYEFMGATERERKTTQAILEADLTAKSVTIDWTVRESARAKIKVM